MKDILQKNKIRTCFFITHEDRALIAAVGGQRPGIIQNTAETAFQRLIYELKRAKLTSYNPSGFDAAVKRAFWPTNSDNGLLQRLDADSASAASVPGSPTSLTGQQVPVGDDGRGAVSVGRPVAPAPSVVSDARVAPAGQKRKRVGIVRTGGASSDNTGA